MTSRKHVPELAPSARRAEIAAILAGGVITWRRRPQAAANIDAQNPSPESENGLELPVETRLSVGTSPSQPTAYGRCRFLHHHSGTLSRFETSYRNASRVLVNSFQIPPEPPSHACRTSS